MVKITISADTEEEIRQADRAISTAFTVKRRKRKKAEKSTEKRLLLWIIAEESRKKVIDRNEQLFDTGGEEYRAAVSSHC